MEENTNTLPATYQHPAPAPAAPASYFADLTAFEACQRMARLLAASDLVPKAYQNNVANTTLALECALQTGISPFFVMQNLNIIQGKPSWAAQFVAGLMNASRRFKGGLRYEMDDDDNPTRCRVWAIDAATGERLNGPAVTLEMARKEGWTGRNGSKWQTMPEVMLGYRAATFFARRHAPDLLLGMRTDDELRDMGEEASAPAPPPERATPAARAIDAAIDAREKDHAAFVAAAAAEPEAEPEPAPAAPAEVIEAEVIEAAPEPPKPEPEDNLPPQLKKYLKAKGEKPRPVPPAEAEPEQAALPMPETPAAQPDARSRNAAMQRFLLDLAGKEGLSELRWWKERNEQKLIEELGEDSEEFQAVIADWMDKVSALERKLKK